MKRYIKIAVVVLSIAAAGYALTREPEIDPMEAAYEQERAKHRAEMGC